MKFIRKQAFLFLFVWNKTSIYTKLCINSSDKIETLAIGQYGINSLWGFLQFLNPKKAPRIQFKSGITHWLARYAVQSVSTCWFDIKEYQKLAWIFEIGLLFFFWNFNCCQVDVAFFPQASWPTWQLCAKLDPGTCWKHFLEIYAVSERTRVTSLYLTLSLLTHKELCIFFTAYNELSWLERNYPRSEIQFICVLKTSEFQNMLMLKTYIYIFFFYSKAYLGTSKKKSTVNRNSSNWREEGWMSNFSLNLIMTINMFNNEEVE